MPTLHVVPWSGTTSGRLYRVARPGRALSRAQVVSDDVVRSWIRKLGTDLAAAEIRGSDATVQYVCLLGWRADGRRDGRGRLFGSDRTHRPGAGASGAQPLRATIVIIG